MTNSHIASGGLGRIWSNLMEAILFLAKLGKVVVLAGGKIQVESHNGI